MTMIMELIGCIVTLVEWLGRSVVNMLNPSAWNTDDIRAIIVLIIIMIYMNRVEIYKAVKKAA